MSEVIELLAPAGRWDVLESVAKAGADAVYIGGKKFNMRLLKGDYNFTDDEIIKAASYLQEQNKKLYVTVNNLYFEQELAELAEYLLFLEEVGVDAIIAQDLSLANIYQELKLKTPLHASVQAGIANSSEVNFYEKLGFSRVILSKNLSLVEIKSIKDNINIGIEYFAHGDMCISHAGQCYMSSFVAGASGNRGRCIKPCRWPYTLNGKEGYFLAHKDLALFPFIKDLVDVGVNSLKIEGRMREADYLSSLIAVYRAGIDEVLAGDYTPNEKLLTDLGKLKIRDVSIASLNSKLDKDAVDITGEKEPFFPTKPRKLEVLKPKVQVENAKLSNKYQELAVKIANKSAYDFVKDYCDTIILSLDKLGEDLGFNIEEVKDFLEGVTDDKFNIKIETPRIVTQKDWPEIIKLAELKKYPNLTGFIVNDGGSLDYLVKEGFRVWGGSSLNITNSKAANLLAQHSVLGFTLSPELKLENIKNLNAKDNNYEVIIHGPMAGIITDYNLGNFYANDEKVNYYLADNFAQSYKFLLDSQFRTHIFYPYDLCLYDYLGEFLSLGIKRFRIEGHLYTKEILAKLTDIYKQRLDDGDKNIDYRAQLLKLFPEGLTDLSYTRPNI
ncbi:MAG: hypothetical protein GX333_09725 [Syntrophomonadaceae bacterium]|nr:hypothetical protein [Syntrophomonadaceae bacterium]